MIGRGRLVYVEQVMGTVATFHVILRAQADRRVVDAAVARAVVSLRTGGAHSIPPVT